MKITKIFYMYVRTCRTATPKIEYPGSNLSRPGRQEAILLSYLRLTLTLTLTVQWLITSIRR
jgi:hypothetical protein